VTFKVRPQGFKPFPGFNPVQLLGDVELEVRRVELEETADALIKICGTEDGKKLRCHSTNSASVAGDFILQTKVHVELPVGDGGDEPLQVASGGFLGARIEFLVIG